MTRNISRSGMFIELEDDRPFGTMDALVGTDLTVSVSLPGQDDEFVCEAVIRWFNSDSRLGIQLVEVSQAHRQVLERLFAAQSGGATPVTQRT